MNHRIKQAAVRLAAVFMLFLFLVSGIKMQANAGFGDFNDYDSGSDWDSGWDSDYDSGSDWDSDYDSDWDYDWDDDGDYDWSSSGNGGYRSGGGSSEDRVIPMLLSVILYVLLMFLATRLISRRRRRVQPRMRRTEPVRTQQRVLPDRTAEISRVIRERDPLFTAPDFISFAKQVYVDIQDAWAKRDLEPVRAVLHQNLYQQTERQIQKKIADGIVNHLERISVNTAYLTSYRRDAQYEYLTVYLAASMIDYQVKEATGEVILGNKTTRWNMYYKMTFMRSNDVKTGSANEKDRGFVCPNCGAPLTGTSFGKCEYCDSIVTTGIYDWVLSDFGVVKNDTRDDGIVVDS